MTGRKERKGTASKIITRNQVKRRATLETSGAHMMKLLTASTDDSNKSTAKLSAAQQKISQLAKEQLWKQARSILRKVPMFRRAPASLVDQLVPALVRWRVPAGTLIIREGEQGSTMYVAQTTHTF